MFGATIDNCNGNRRRLKLRLDKNILLIIFAYTVSHGLLLINDGLYWDDWIYYYYDLAQNINHFSQFGNVLLGYYFSYIFSLNEAIFCFRALTFLLYLMTALLLYSILKTVKEIDGTSRLFLVIFFVVFPLNSARVSIATSYFAIGYFLFFCGLWLISRYFGVSNIRDKTLLRAFSLIAFLFSFFLTNSLLFFYAIVLLYILYQGKEGPNRISVRGVIRVATKYPDFVVIPILFFAVRHQFLEPYGLYAGYNEITSNSLLQAPFWLIASYYTSFVRVLVGSASNLWAVVFALSLVGASAIFYLYRMRYGKNRTYLRQLFRGLETVREKNIFKLFVIGLILFGAGAFPYVAVGKLPTVGGWESRHQLLLPLGASFMLYFGIIIATQKLPKRSLFRGFVLFTIIILFTATNVMSYVDYQKDWYKQVSLIDNFQDNEVIRDHTTFLFQDQSSDLNANNRSYEFYEYAGLMRYAFGTDTRFGSDVDSYVNVSYYKTYSSYNLVNYTPKEPEYKIIIEKGGYDMTFVNTLKLMFYQRFEPDKYDYNVHKIISLKPIQLTNSSGSL